MSHLLIAGILGVVLSCLGAIWLWVILRRHTYRRHLKYSPEQGSAETFSSASVETIPLEVNRGGFLMPRISPEAASGFLELDVQSKWSGSTFDPSLEIRVAGFADEQVLSRGVCGMQHFNLSRLIAAVPEGGKVSLRGHHLGWKPGSARLHLSRERLQSEDRVLVISSHPDDAEIAAFGLYADTHSTVVTVTAGDASDRYSGNSRTATLSRSLMARIRVWDSILIPQFGGVPPERAVNLCYPDGELSRMYSERNLDTGQSAHTTLDFAGLRRLNISPLVRPETDCSWRSLIRDLTLVILATKPTVIVAPHPWLDPHEDHRFSTVAVCEAVRDSRLSEGRFLFYVNHNRYSELWPFGPSGSGVSRLPVLPSDIVDCDDFYSHPLSEKRQGEKYLALEAMHDLGELRGQQPHSAATYSRRIRSDIGALLTSLGTAPTSYFRRAVRPDELFYVASLERGERLCQRATGSLPETSVHEV